MPRPSAAAGIHAILLLIWNCIGEFQRHSRATMHFRTAFLLAALGLTQWQTASAATESVPGPALVTEGASAHFQAVASKLELGGASFTYAEEGDIMALLGEFFEEVMKSLPKEDNPKLPPNFSFQKVFGLVGLDSIKASGTSSRKTAGGMTHLRSFVYTPAGRRGLLSLTGGAPQPLLATTLATKDTDLIIEFPLHLKDLMEQAWPVFLDLVPEGDRAVVEAAAAQPQPPLGISYQEMAQKLSVRIGLIVTLMPEQTLVTPGNPVELPGINAAIVIDKLGWLKDILKERFLPMLQDPNVPLEVTNENGVITGRFRTPVGPAPMDFQPAFILDESADRLIIATRTGYLDGLLGKEPRLSEQPEFAAAWAGLPKDGNGCLFLSKRLLQTFINAVKTSISKDETFEEKALALKFMDLLSKYANATQVLTYANLPDGILGASNISFPVINPGSVSSITTLAVLSSLAVPAINKAQAQASQTQVLNHGKQVAIAIKTYAADHDGKYPPKLKQLVSTGVLENAELLTVAEKKGKEGLPWLYDRSLTDSSDGDSILLAAPFSIKGSSGKETRVVIRNDGSAAEIDEEEFEGAKGEELK